MSHCQFSALIDVSTRMRDLVSILKRVARADVPILICGETGTGEELVAEALHAASPRANGPFVVCDLGALGPTLLESELFGHRRGAFMSAAHERQGAFVRVEGARFSSLRSLTASSGVLKNTHA